MALPRGMQSEATYDFKNGSAYELISILLSGWFGFKIWCASYRTTEPVENGLSTLPQSGENEELEKDDKDTVQNQPQKDDLMPLEPVQEKVEPVVDKM